MMEESQCQPAGIGGRADQTHWQEEARARVLRRTRCQCGDVTGEGCNVFLSMRNGRTKQVRSFLKLRKQLEKQVHLPGSGIAHAQKHVAFFPNDITTVTVHSTKHSSPHFPSPAGLASSSTDTSRLSSIIFHRVVAYPP